MYFGQTAQAVNPREFLTKRFLRDGAGPVASEFKDGTSGPESVLGQPLNDSVSIIMMARIHLDRRH